MRRISPANATTRLPMPDAVTADATVEALVTAAYGRRMRLRLDDGTAVNARIKGRKLQPVCGDRVRAQALENESDWLIVAITERINELTRPNMRGKTEILAANLDLLAAVCASTPQPDWYVIDRYLCAAELMGIKAALIYNKADDGEIDASAAAELDIYREIDYATAVCSAQTGHSLEAIRNLLRGHTAIVVGQSGVGKSTLINAITEGSQRTAQISNARGEGRHTTVTATMLSLPGGGRVIDSPGVRDYAPAIDSPADVEYGFREIREFGRDCRFANCRHRREPQCAVLETVESHRISPRRYESYKRMLALTERLERGRY